MNFFKFLFWDRLLPIIFDGSLAYFIFDICICVYLRSCRSGYTLTMSTPLGVRYVGEVACPEQSGDTWEYWSAWREEWVEDWSLEATCSDDGPTEGPVSKYELVLGAKLIIALK